MSPENAVHTTADAAAKCPNGRRGSYRIMDEGGDEKIESFVWLLQTFKKSMGGKKSNIYLYRSGYSNEQCHQSGKIQGFILKVEVVCVFPDARHRLCVWHLNQNAITSWRSMLQTYELIGEEWFTNVHDLREKWCPALSKDLFSAGILSSQRSESKNHAIGFRANTTTSLTDFYRLFNGTMQRWKSTEKEVEFSCSKSVASSSLPLSGLLKHASEVYTLSLFRDFEEEFGYSIATTSKLIWTQGNTQFYGVSIDEEPWSAQRGIAPSFSKPDSRTVHKKRWKKSAKSSVWNKLENENPKEVQYTPWCQTMARKYYNLILKSQSNEETRTLMEDGYVATVSLVDELLVSLNLSNVEDALTTQKSGTPTPETSTSRAPETNTDR
ncbi:protein FAR-RED IMPAIRED RESPONSE 1-like [Spinacia oleracea]|uniref:Protein FAR-RED IMPAIRED RESPONSE 1-like n=1 Tax=Spinacia oleracea TaxID=3562 RepID=A0ABM3RJM0_SPIOL|nr:protein FAR-RED IMPAIRED RESPONSE 1-like [Spinacia oleracea]